MTSLNDLNGSDEPVEEDDWFGEGNAFNSGEELAAALLTLAPTGPGGGRVAEQVAAVVPPPEDEFSPALGSSTWSVRTPGAVALPARQPGRSGWTIRNSVQVLHQAEEILNQLREEAVDAAFEAAARVYRASA